MGQPADVTTDGRAPGRVLVTGWFSFPDGEITAGDLLARDAALADLRDLGVEADVAMTRTFVGSGPGVGDPAGSVDVAEVDPARYDTVLFVCGPARGRQLEDLARRFGHARLVGVNVSVVDGPMPLHAALARDGAGEARPDTSLRVPSADVPVVGVCLAHAQHEYGDGQRHDTVHEVLTAALAAAVPPLPGGGPAASGSPVALVPFDTRLARAEPGVPVTAAQVESLVRRLDAVVSSRLHGMVLALKNAVPVLAVDPVEGGAKVAAQGRALGWPVLLPADVTPGRVADALGWVLSAQAREQARAVLPAAQARARDASRELAALLAPPQGVRRG